MAKGRVSAEELEIRLAETGKLLVRRRSYVDVERELVARYGIHSRTARKWIRKVKATWVQHSDAETSADARADLMAQLDAVLASAWSNMVVVRDKDNNPVLDQNPASPGFGKPLVRNEPKVQHILHAVSQLRALRGADKPIKAIVTLDADINAMPDLDAISTASVDLLRKFIESVAPEGDIRKLAGDWFKAPEDDKPK